MVQKFKSKNEVAKILDDAKVAYLHLGDDAYNVLTNPLLDRSQYDIENPHIHTLRIMRNPDYFHFTCKWLFNIDLLPFQGVILKELWTKTFPMLVATRGGGKSWILSLYAMLRALFDQGSKVVIVGAAFRQSKLLFEYMETFWRQAPMLQNIVGWGKHQGPKRDVDRCTFYVGDSVVHAIPLGDGTKIRGLRATHTIADEFASIPQEVFETVVGGFSAVSLNPVLNVKRHAEIEYLRDHGLWGNDQDEEERLNNIGNQTVISGTAYYSFNHFADYWKRWKSIIESKGRQEKLEEIFNGKIPEGFDHRKYSVIRVPYHKLPKGFMDATQVARAKATIHSSIYQMEYGACFCTDSDGFFKRSLIESCICSKLEQPFIFNAVTRGNPNAKYIYGIDPASERDNFSIVILEKHPDHHRVVYSWVATRAKHREKLKKGLTSEHDFYQFCARKIRELMKVFPTEHIAIDAQGGGRAVMEALQDPDKFDGSLGEVKILPYIKDKNDNFWWEEEKKPTDGESGLHIIHSIEFANSDWVQKANHGLKKDLEDKVLLFPHFDPWVVQEAILHDSQLGIKDDDDYRLYDTLEDCTMDIEELKDELTTIQLISTPTGKDKWDTPETVEAGGKRGRLRKDRYSALLMANMVARTLGRTPPVPEYHAAGGFVGKDYSKVVGIKSGQGLYNGPANLTSKMGNLYGMGVNRR